MTKFSWKYTEWSNFQWVKEERLCHFIQITNAKWATVLPWFNIHLPLEHWFKLTWFLWSWRTSVFSPGDYHVTIVNPCFVTRYEALKEWKPHRFPPGVPPSLVEEEIRQSVALFSYFLDLTTHVHSWRWKFLNHYWISSTSHRTSSRSSFELIKIL